MKKTWYRGAANFAQYRPGCPGEIQVEHKQYHPGPDKTYTGLMRVGDDLRNGGETTRQGLMARGGHSHFTGVDYLQLQMVASSFHNGISPLEFMSSINAGNELFGNRLFMRWVARLRNGERVPDVREIAAEGLHGAGRPLTHLDILQQSFGRHDIRAMREHTDAAAVATLNALGVEGFTSGGRMALSENPGLYLQAHEAAHAVQQAALGSRMQLHEGIGEAGDRYERNADMVAEAVTKGEPAEPLLDEMTGHSTQVAPVTAITDAPVQMKWPDKNLEDLSMEEFEAAIREMTDEELDEAWEELTLLLDIIELEEAEAGIKPASKKGKKGKYKPTPEEIEAMRAAKKTQVAVSPAGKSKKQKQQEKAPAKKSGTKSKDLTLENMQGLDDMFLARALNHLIMGELYELDPMIGDEGCQMRTPFVLDMYRLVQQKMPAGAAGLVNAYRARAGAEQVAVFEQMRELEERRRGKDPKYANAISELIKSNPLAESVGAKSGEYETMLAGLLAEIGNSEPANLEYLRHVCSEGSIYWHDVLDPFGISILTDRHSIFPESVMNRRKAGISRHSKRYMAQIAARLVEMKGGNVSSEERELGFDKKKVMQINPGFLVARTKKEDILSMLLHAIQMHCGAASLKGNRLEMGPCWETVRLALTYALKQGDPLIVNLRRLIVSGSGDEREYTTNLARTLFYEAGEEGYKYQPNPSASQRARGALLFLGYSMLKEGDTEMPGVTSPVAPWIFEREPEKFLAGFTRCDIANILFLGGAGTHPPLNTFAPGSNVYELPGGPASDCNMAANDPGGVLYSEAIHDWVLADLGQSDMTEYGREFLIPKSNSELQEEYEQHQLNKAAREAGGAEVEPYLRTLFRLTDKAKKLMLPDQCPINIGSTGAGFNIKEEYQLLKLLSVAAGLKNVIYSKDNRAEGTAQRVAARTLPFSIIHILASNFAHEDELSRKYAVPQTRGIIEKLDDLLKR